MAEEKDELSGLEEANRKERELILGARDNPEETWMHDGLSVSQHQRKMFKEHSQEGQKALETQRQRVREQSIGGDPLYQGKAEPLKGAPSSFTVIPDSEQEQRSRFESSQKVSKIVDPKEAKTPVSSVPPPPPPVATNPPEKTNPQA